LDFRYDHAGKLHVFIYFRSWDLYSGFPANLAGLQLLLEYVAAEIGATPGKMICASKGLHIYSYAIAQAADRLGMTDVATMDDFLAWVEKEKNV
jgi:thymidylate synthase